MASGYRIPQQQEISQAINFLVHQQFPKLLDRSIKYFSVLPKTGVYRHVNSEIVPFGEALLETTSQDFTLSGVGSLIDYERYGVNIKRPSPHLLGSSCGSGSLCLEPVCFGFTEGVIESNNVINNICWSLAMPCLKDRYYADAQFDKKMNRYFSMYFKQAPAVLEAFQRTRLLQEAIKVVCTDKNIRFSGSVIGGEDGQSLPFYINPVDATTFPDLNTMGAGIGGANLSAFINYVAPRLFGSSFTGDAEDLKVYGLKQDYLVAKEQTASVQDHFMDQQLLAAIRSRGGSVSDSMDSLLGDFAKDDLFPTFKNVGGRIVPIPQEILEASTIAGYVQTSNPEHALATIRGLLFVPNNCKFKLIEPPKDDFSDLGLGQGLNFRLNTPGVTPILSSSMFKANKMGDREIILGNSGGNYMEPVKGLQKRGKSLDEAVRTEVMMTYSALECGTGAGLPNVGVGVMPQARADGFKLKSTMFLGTDFEGTAKPVLLLFKTDTPRSARPIQVCDVVEVEVSSAPGTPSIKHCAPGNQTYVVLTFDRDVSALYTNGNSVTYRTGNNAQTFLGTVTAVSGSVVSIAAANGTDILPCCTGGSDDYGVRAELLNNTTTSLQTSEILKAKYDVGTSRLVLGFMKPLVAKAVNTDAKITLEDGTVINVRLAVLTTAGVLAQVVPAPGETCDLTKLDSSCLMKAVFSYII